MHKLFLGEKSFLLTEISNKKLLINWFFSFFVQSPLLPIDENLRAQISAVLNSEEPLDIPVTIFDEAQLQIENEINTTTYPNFLQSEIYLQCLEVRIQTAQ